MLHVCLGFAFHQVGCICSCAYVRACALSFTSSRRRGGRSRAFFFPFLEWKEEPKKKIPLCCAPTSWREAKLLLAAAAAAALAFNLLLRACGRVGSLLARLASQRRYSVLFVFVGFVKRRCCSGRSLVVTHTSLLLLLLLLPACLPACLPCLVAVEQSRAGQATSQSHYTRAVINQLSLLNRFTPHSPFLMETVKWVGGWVGMYQ